MTTLEIVTNKIKSLDEGNVVAAMLNFGRAEILVPLTDEGRKLLRALLVEIGRHECELANAKKDEFVKTVNAEESGG